MNSRITKEGLLNLLRLALDEYDQGKGLRRKVLGHSEHLKIIRFLLNLEKEGKKYSKYGSLKDLLEAIPNLNPIPINLLKEIINLTSNAKPESLTYQAMEKLKKELEMGVRAAILFGDKTLPKNFTTANRNDNHQTDEHSETNANNVSAIPDIMPDEILLHIFSFLNPNNLSNVKAVCNQFNKISNDYTLCPKIKTGHACQPADKDKWVKVVSSNDGSKFLFVGQDGKCYIASSDDSKPHFIDYIIFNCSCDTQIEFTATGNYLLIFNPSISNADSIRILSLQNNTVKESGIISNKDTHAIIKPLWGNYFLVAKENSLSVFNAETGQCEKSLFQDYDNCNAVNKCKYIKDVVVSPGGKCVAFLAREDIYTQKSSPLPQSYNYETLHQLYICNTVTGDFTALATDFNISTSDKRPLKALRFAYDHAYLYLNANNVLKKMNLLNGKSQTIGNEKTKPSSSVKDVAVSTNSAYIAIANSKTSIQLFNFAGEIKQELTLSEVEKVEDIKLHFNKHDDTLIISSANGIEIIDFLHYSELDQKASPSPNHNG